MLLNLQHSEVPEDEIRLLFIVKKYSFLSFYTHTRPLETCRVDDRLHAHSSTGCFSFRAGLGGVDGGGIQKAWVLLAWAYDRKIKQRKVERHTDSPARDKDDHSSGHMSRACWSFHLIRADNCCGG